MERILYSNADFCAVAEGRRLVEYIPAASCDEAGRILWGKVQRIMPALEAAFVDIGRKRAGFLPLKENSSSFQGSPLRSGDRVLVQIRKEETGEKGAYLTRDLCIPGSCLILMPMNRHLGVSARITESSERTRLQETGMRLTGGSFGLVMREAALRATETELKAELEDLRKQWNHVLEGETLGGSIEEELLRDYTPRGITSVIRNQPLSADFSRQLSEAKNRMIHLPHGGNIVIDVCEALTVVDVNSASDAAGGNREETALETNLEACQEIMIQARLRNISGILILDMIDMNTEAYRQRVVDALGSAFREDRVKTVIHGFTSLGLIEMTRKRTRPALAEMW